jgi:hypothetical protein
MSHNRKRMILATASAKLVIAILAMAVLTSSVAAQCPTMNAEGFTFGTTNFNTVKTQMWYNDGVWWGAFSDNFDGIHFYSFPNNAAVQGPIIDSNITGIPDALWDGTNLFVSVWKSVSLATLYKYTYNSATKTHTLVSGFPVNLPLNGSSTSAIVLEKDTTGKLWATYTGTQGGLSDGKVRVIWSTSADHKVWNTTGFELESGLTANLIEISAITHFGGNKIGIAWSNQPAKQIAFRYHVDGTSETTWSAKEIVDSGNGPRNLGGVADDHLSIKGAPDGRIFLAAKDNDNDGSPGHQTEGRIHLYVRTVAGTWGQKTNVQPDFSQLPTRPVLLLDTTNNRAYVIYHDDSPSGAGRNFIAHTDMNNISFDFPCVFNITGSSNPTSTKQYVSPSTGIMVVASTGATGSNELVFRSVVLPQPMVINTLSPTSRSAGAGGFTLTVNGTGFVDGSFVQWNGNDRLTNFVNSTQLTAQIGPDDVSTAGTFAVKVSNPSTGAVSNTVNFSVNNPAPTLSTISPTNKNAGDGAFTLTVNGTNFVNGSAVNFNGSSRPTTFNGSTQLLAQISAADIQTAGTYPITVFNPAPGGGTSGAVNLVVNNTPLPTLSSINPTTKIVGDAAFSLTVNGTNFVAGSVVRFSGVDRTTTFGSATQLTAQITAADLQTAGSYAITVNNPGVGASNAVNLTVNNPVPSLSSISPTPKNAGEAAFTLTVNGSGFVNGAIVRFNGNNRTTSFVGGTQLTAQITAADISAAGSFPITVLNPTPGGGTSNAINLVVNFVNPPPSISSLSPTSKQAGSGAFTLTVNGSSFIASSEVRWNGTPRVTSFVNSGQLTAQINAADIASQGTAAVTVFNPAPGGGTSNSINFTIDSAGGGCIGYESDVAPRPNGSNNGFITVSDWVQTGRFSAGLDTPNPPCEFQRADSAPRGSLGNGAITVSDWVQAGRYAAGLDPVTPIGGPTGPPLAPEKLAPGPSVEAESERIIRVVGDPFSAGQQVGSIAIEMDSQGDENALGFSVTFDPAKLSYVSAVAGSGAAGTSMNVNATQAAAGRVGVAMSHPAGASFTAGTKQLVVVTFNVASGASGSTVINFGNTPIFREIVSVAATELDGTYVPTTLNIVPPSNPVPAITTLNPTAAAVGGSAFPMTVNGSNFISGSVVKWNGVDRPTTLVNATQLTAQIPASDIQAAGIIAITVVNPAPAGGVSNIVNFPVNNPSPSASGLSPSSALVGDAAFTLVVNGSNFVNGSVVAWDGDNRATTFVSNTQLTAQILASDLLTTDDVPVEVTVTNPGPGGGVSGAVNFTVNNPSPAISGLAPGTTVAGGVTFLLTVNGSNFVSGATVRWNGSNRPTSFINSSQLTAHISAADIATAGNASITVFNPTPGGGISSSVAFTISVPPPVLHFSAQSFNASEGVGSAEITVTRSGDTSGAASVDYSISDPVGYAPCLVSNGAAAQNCDYTIIAGTLHFASGESSKSFSIPLIDDVNDELDETLNFKLTNAAGASLGSISTASLMIVDNDSSAPSTNPIDEAQYFVRQHYLDFLNREPDAGGLGFWSSRITGCNNEFQDQEARDACIRNRRIEVSGAFFIELEFQKTGSVVYRMHKAAYGERPSYTQFMPDRSLLVAGSQLLATTQSFANRFVLRPEFKAAYPDTMSNSEFVQKLFDSAELMNNPAQRQQYLDALNTGSKSRAEVLLDLIEIDEFKTREYNASFVLMQYFGYLRRDPDQGGYDFWLNVLNNQEPNNYQGMICSFLTSREYQVRFSSVVTRSNSQCGQ